MQSASLFARLLVQSTLFALRMGFIVCTISYPIGAGLVLLSTTKAACTVSPIPILCDVASLANYFGIAALVDDISTWIAGFVDQLSPPFTPPILRSTPPTIEMDSSTEIQNFTALFETAFSVSVGMSVILFVGKLCRTLLANLAASVQHIAETSKLADPTHGLSESDVRRRMVRFSLVTRFCLRALELFCYAGFATTAVMAALGLHVASWSPHLLLERSVWEGTLMTMFVAPLALIGLLLLMATTIWLSPFVYYPTYQLARLRAVPVQVIATLVFLFLEPSRTLVASTLESGGKLLARASRGLLKLARLANQLAARVGQEAARWKPANQIPPEQATPAPSTEPPRGPAQGT